MENDPGPPSTRFPDCSFYGACLTYHAHTYEPMDCRGCQRYEPEVWYPSGRELWLYCYIARVIIAPEASFRAWLKTRNK